MEEITRCTYELAHLRSPFLLLVAVFTNRLAKTAASRMTTTVENEGDSSAPSFRVHFTSETVSEIARDGHGPSRRLRYLIELSISSFVSLSFPGGH